MKHLIIFLFLVMFVSFGLKSKRTNDNEKLDYFIEKSHEESAEPEFRIMRIDSLVDTTEENNPLILFDKARKLSDAGYNSQAYELLKGMRPRVKDYPLNIRLRWIYEYAMSLNEIGNNLASLAMIEKLQNTPKPDSLRYWDFRAELAKFNIYDDFGENAKAMNALKSAEEMLPRLSLNNPDQRDEQARIHGNWATIHMQQKNYGEAFKEIQMARQLSNSNSVKMGTLIQLALLYLDKKEPAMAQKYIEDALKIPVNNRNRRSALYVLALCRLQQGDPNGAIDALNLYPSENIRDNFPANQRAYYMIRGQSYAAAGNLALAYCSLDSALAMGDSIKAFTDRFYSVNAEEYLETSRKLGRAERINRVLLCVLIGVGVLCILLVLSQLGLGRRYRKASREMRNLREEAQSAIEAQTQLKRRQETEAGYQQQNERKLSTSMMKLSHVQTLLEKIFTVSSEPGPAEEKLQSIKGLLRVANVKENLWELFQLQLEETNHEFIARLTAMHPNLSKAELRMCIFILHNMPNKDIAQMIDRSPYTVETTKRNLRRRLKLPHDITTETYLRKFL